MHAFVRFRRPETEDGDLSSPGSSRSTTSCAAPFFVGRFAAMRWSILTPDGSLHWNGRELAFAAGVSRADAPSGDALEDWWLTYYRAVFNPARANAAAMRAEMPKKYWCNLPEAALIPQLLAEAPKRTQIMLESPPARRRKRIRQAAPSAAPTGGTRHH